jgi:YjbE family integral membrane protein
VDSGTLAGLDTLAVALFNIVTLDIVLSGDNAVVIGMAVHALPPRQARAALLVGGGLAIVLRITLTALAATLLSVPLLQLVGAVALGWITYHLLSEDNSRADEMQTSDLRFRDAIRTIIVADITMSLDNVLAVGAAARGSVELLILGLVLSMAILLAGGALVAALIERAHWLNYVGAGVLIVLAGQMATSDEWLRANVPWASSELAPWVFSGVLALLIFGLLWSRRRPSPPQKRKTTGDAGAGITP